MEAALSGAATAKRSEDQEGAQAAEEATAKGEREGGDGVSDGEEVDPVGTDPYEYRDWNYDEKIDGYVLDPDHDPSNPTHKPAH